MLVDKAKAKVAWQLSSAIVSAPIGELLEPTPSGWTLHEERDHETANMGRRSSSPGPRPNTWGCILGCMGCSLGRLRLQPQIHACACSLCSMSMSMSMSMYEAPQPVAPMVAGRMTPQRSPSFRPSTPARRPSSPKGSPILRPSIPRSGLSASTGALPRLSRATSLGPGAHVYSSPPLVYIHRTPLHPSAPLCTPLHTSAHPCTPLHTGHTSGTPRRTLRFTAPSRHRTLPKGSSPVPPPPPPNRASSPPLLWTAASQPPPPPRGDRPQADLP